MVTLSFDNPSQIITVMAPDTEITIQELHNKIREYEDDLDNHSYGIICDTSGKEQLLGGVQVGLTMVLYDWKVKFESRAGPTYVQCAISGGNVVGYDTGTSTYGSPLEPSDYVYAVITSSSSATLQELESIQYSSFQQGVWIDITSSYTGTDFPVGTPQAPVNNVADAKQIADDRGFEKFYIIGDITFSTGDDIENFIIQGQSPVKTTITIETAALTLGCDIREATVAGTLDGGTCIKNCVVGELAYVEGRIMNSVLTDTITLAGSSVTHIYQCYDGQADGIVPTIDMGGSGRDLIVAAYSGDIKITNLTGAQYVSIDLISGRIDIDSTVTAGTFTVRGIGRLVDDSTGTTVNSMALLCVGCIADAVLDEALADHTTAGSLGEAVGTLKGRKTIPSP